MAETKTLRMKISGVLLLLLMAVPAHPQFKLAIFSPSLDYAVQLKETGTDFTGIFADLNLFEVGFPAIPLSKGYNPGYHYLGCAVLKIEVAKDIFVLSPLQFVMTFTLWSRGLQSCMAAVSLGLLNAGFHLAGDPSAFYAPEIDIRVGFYYDVFSAHIGVKYMVANPGQFLGWENVRFFAGVTVMTGLVHYEWLM
jgi:hypothetical protein